jgi:hypothetical protein
MALPDVVGTGVGLTEDQKPAVVIFSKKTASAEVIPEMVEDTPVVTVVTGEIMAMKETAKAKRPPAINPAGWFARPVPIGVSTGNFGECSAGTISARVKDGSGNVYALSNNHVYALENGAVPGSYVVQPGNYDNGCIADPNNAIGTLSQFVPISFAADATNTIDAAIALSGVDLLGNGTPPNGYGKPGSAVVAAGIGLAVQKYGRTTGLTTGTIQAINATISVSYSTGTATFVNQIVVYARRGFIKAGDSGSLLVTGNAAANPVGLLFAGNSSGSYGIANPIDAVLNSFGVSIDGK